jgi:hypothetical protein
VPPLLPDEPELLELLLLEEVLLELLDEELLLLEELLEPLKIFLRKLPALLFVL